MKRLIVALVCTLWLLPAAGAEKAEDLIVHLLDYIAVDYPGFVKDGKVVDADEYKEQLEFSGQVATLLGTLPKSSATPHLAADARRLKSLIENKAPGADVSTLATSLRWDVIKTYNVATAPKLAPDLKRGAVLYAEHCAGCHGTDGRGDGPQARGLDPAPANFHEAARMSQRSLHGLYSTITLGVNGTGMKGYGTMPDADRWALAYYTGTLGYDAATLEAGMAAWRKGTAGAQLSSLAVISTLSDRDAVERLGPGPASALRWLKANPAEFAKGRESPLAFARRTLQDSVEAYREGRRPEAQQKALTAYLEGFELIEATLDTVDHELRLSIERGMGLYREMLNKGMPVDDVAAAASSLDHLMSDAARKIEGTSLSPATAATSAFFILVREGLEALLVVAAIIAMLTRAGHRRVLPWIHAGWIGALLAGLATWFVAATLIDISGAARELTEGITALFAAAILLYLGFWLHDKSYANAWKIFLEQKLTKAIDGGALWALAGVSFLAVYREAFETVLFYQALWQQVDQGGHGAVLGGLAGGIAALGVTAWLMFRFSVRLPIGPFFTACSVLMTVLAIVFTGQGVKALQEAGLIGESNVGSLTLAPLGIYPTSQTLVAQAIVTVVVIAGFAWLRAEHRRSAKRA
jgi:high-affinity iron transporter